MNPLPLAALAAGLAVLTKDDGPPNTYGLPDGAPLRRKLVEFFRRQQAAVLGTLDTIGVALDAFPDVGRDWSDPMAHAMTPLISAYWDEAGQQTRERLGLDPDEWRVTDPHLREMIGKASFHFCDATNKTTTLALNDALDKLRREITEGMVERGDTLRQLRKRVEGVFDKAEEWRAQRIAATEASRAVHAAELESARQSGVVAGVRWLVSGDACPLCMKVAAEAPQVRLGQEFAVIGDNPDYASIKHPPLHPGCQCSLIEVLTPEYGGPKDPKWATTLIQPKADDDYQPPEGVVPPVPEPRALVGPLRKPTDKPAPPRPADDLEPVTLPMGPQGGPPEGEGEAIPARPTDEPTETPKPKPKPRKPRKPRKPKPAPTPDPDKEPVQYGPSEWTWGGEEIPSKPKD